MLVVSQPRVVVLDVAVRFGRTYRTLDGVSVVRSRMARDCCRFVADKFLVEEEDGVLSKVVFAIVPITSSGGRGLLHSLFSNQSSNCEIFGNRWSRKGRIDELKFGIRRRISHVAVDTWTRPTVGF